MNMKYRPVLLLSLLCVIFASGCGTDKELSEFETDMTTFKDHVTDISETMNAIDPVSETAVEELLTCLDDMNGEFQFLGEMTVPKEFSNIETLADEAASYMSEANSLYHQYYSGEEPDDTLKDQASENYSRALKRITYISELLQGKIPDGSDVEVTEENGYDFEPVTEAE